MSLIRALKGWTPVVPRLSIPTSIGISIQLPAFEWPSIFLAAPKQRQSHSKKRHRQLAGNTALKPMKNLGRCPSCGRVKRSHTLCMPCVFDVRKLWRESRKVEMSESKTTEVYDEAKLGDADREFNFPLRIQRPSTDAAKLADRRSYILYRRTPQAASFQNRKTTKLPLIVRRPYEQVKSS